MPLSRVTIVGLGDSTIAGTPVFRSPLDARVGPVASPVLPHNPATGSASGDTLPLNACIETVRKALGTVACAPHAAVGYPADSNRLRGSPDGLHPDVAGYRAMGEVLARTIEDHLRRSERT